MKRIGVIFFLLGISSSYAEQGSLSIEKTFEPKNINYSPVNSTKNNEKEYIPNDVLFASQWAAKNSKGYDMGLTSAWLKSRGSKKLAIVIIDSGVDYTHPDLKNNMWVNPHEIANNGIDDDNNGYIDDIHGINAIKNTGDPMDDNGHGTFMAGVIGAEGDNNAGIAGVMHEVSLIACKFLDKNGSGNFSNAIKCLDYALDLSQRDIGLTIVATNNAYGGGQENQGLYSAIERHRDAGILFVTSSGSSAESLEEIKSYPASYDLANIIVVAKANQEGKLIASSNYGSNSVHLAAPGENIVSTTLGGAYQVWNGSVAAAFITGLLGLNKAIDQDLSWAQLKHKLLKNTLDLDSEDASRLISGGLAYIKF